MAAKTFIVVLEAAFWMLRAGIANVLGEIIVNLKQARCLLT